jgi:hypothetical protein
MYNKHENDINRRDFELDKAKLTEFITTYTDKSIRSEDNIHGKKKYMIELQKIANQTLKVLEIHIEDLDHHFSNDSFFFDLLKSNTKRYVNLLYEVIDKVMPRRTTKNLEEELEPIEEVIQNQRMANLQANNGNGSDRQVTRDQIPPELLRK